jgi:hypothetical protein
VFWGEEEIEIPPISLRETAWFRAAVQSAWEHVARNNVRPWEISITFTKTSSRAFQQTLAIAKTSPKFTEHLVDGAPLYRATFNATPEQFFAFEGLYAITSNWKSCLVFINREMVDRKVLHDIRWCYGEKCRSGNEDYCFGYNPWTANPFGCFRLQQKALVLSWWEYGKFDSGGVWWLDKERMIRKIKAFSVVYRFCPSFNLENMLAMVDRLPAVIDPAMEPDWDTVAKERWTDGARVEIPTPTGFRQPSENRGVFFEITDEDIFGHSEE